jgi:hypothetical protein
MSKKLIIVLSWKNLENLLKILPNCRTMPIKIARSAGTISSNFRTNNPFYSFQPFYGISGLFNVMIESDAFLIGAS